MKLIIQIPCFNEENSLPITFKDLPKKIQGVDSIEYLLINDGSEDKTIEVAKKLGFNHIVNIPKNKGLANAFKIGINECLKHGADIIVNTDADNQYNGDCVGDLIKPILLGQAEAVIGQRPINEIKDFSLIKKKMEKLGSWVVGLVSSIKISDAPSGFRAFSRDAALKINIISNYTYTLENIIQMGRKNIVVTTVPVIINKSLRDSRLVKNNLNYIFRSLITIVRIFAIYKPLRFFTFISILPCIASMVLFIRFIVFYAMGLGDLFIKSLITGGVVLILALIIFTIGLLSDIISTNRALIEDILYKVKKIEYNNFKKS